MMLHCFNRAGQRAEAQRRRLSAALVG
jgi:hypothetical protein